MSVRVLGELIHKVVNPKPMKQKTQTLKTKTGEAEVRILKGTI